LMFVLLPPNLRALAALAADQGHARFSATSCVRLTQEPSGLYRAEATDGHVLGIARGPSPEGPDVIDPALADDAAELLIGAKDWQGAFGLRPKRRVGEALAVASAAGAVLFASRKGTSRAPRGEGRFPDTARVLPEGLPLASVLVDPDMLGRVLKVAAAFREEGSRGVTLHFWPGRGLLGVPPRTPQAGQAFAPLCAPLPPAKSCPPADPPPAVPLRAPGVHPPPGRLPPLASEGHPMSGPAARTDPPPR